MAVKIEHQGSIPPELNVFERVNFFSSPPVDWTESYAYTESEQELDGFTQCDPQVGTPGRAATAGLGQLPSRARRDNCSIKQW